MSMSFLFLEIPQLSLDFTSLPVVALLQSCASSRFGGTSQCNGIQTNMEEKLTAVVLGLICCVWQMCQISAATVTQNNHRMRQRTMENIVFFFFLYKMAETAPYEVTCYEQHTTSSTDGPYIHYAKYVQDPALISPALVVLYIIFTYLCPVQ